MTQMCDPCYDKAMAAMGCKHPVKGKKQMSDFPARPVLAKAEREKALDAQAKHRALMAHLGIGVLTDSQKQAAIDLADGFGGSPADYHKQFREGR